MQRIGGLVIEALSVVVGVLTVWLAVVTGVVWWCVAQSRDERRQRAALRDVAAMRASREPRRSFGPEVEAARRALADAKRKAPRS